MKYKIKDIMQGSEGKFINNSIFCCNIYKTSLQKGLWFRIFGRGLSITKSDLKFFLVKNGHRKQFSFFGWRIEFLKKWAH